MNLNEQALSEELYTLVVADREAIRARVLEQAHRELAETAPRKPLRWLKFAAGPLAACLAFFVLVNVSAPFAAAVEQVPVLGTVARLITLRQWDSENDSSSIHGELPLVEGTGNQSLETKVNALIGEKMTTLDEEAQAYAAEYRENWLAMGNDPAAFVPLRYTFDYETFYASDTALSFLIRQRETITTDTEDTYTSLYYYNLNLATGEDLTLADLLGADWKDLVAAQVDDQIRDSGDARKISYYQEFWVDKNVPYDDTQKFYLNRDGQVTVVFDEGYVAPFEEGPQRFVISSKVR